MNGNDLYRGFNNVDEDILERSESVKGNRKKTLLVKWGIIAACLCVLIIGAITVFSDNRESMEENVVSSSVADVAPMVCVDGVLYQQSVISYAEAKSEFVYLGKIETHITNGSDESSDGIPKENFQANVPIVGSEVYEYGNNIVIRINGKYWLHEPLEENLGMDWNELTEEEKMQLDPMYNP